MKLCAGLLLFCLAASTQAQTPAGFTKLELPPTLNVKQELTAPPPNWQPSRGEIKPMVKAITVFDGDPKEQASLVPDKDVTSKTAPYTVWTFAAKATRPIWVQVQYTGTQMQIARALPVGTRELRVYYEPNQRIDGYGAIRQVVYR